MNHKNKLGPSLAHLDSCIDPFSKAAKSKIGGSTTCTTENHDYDRLGTQQKSTFPQRSQPALLNTAPPAMNSALQFQQRAVANSLQDTHKMSLWLQQNNPVLLAQLSQLSNTQMPELANTNTSPHSHISAMESLPQVPMSAPQRYTTTASPLPVHPNISKDYGRMASALKHSNLQLADQLKSANQTIAVLKGRLFEQEKFQAHHHRLSSTIDSERFHFASPSLDESVAGFVAHPHEAATIYPSPIKVPSPMEYSDPPTTPTNLQPPSTPQHASYRAGRRHHRTATPEQRSIRAMMGNKPVFTVGIDPQNDRCLLSDFFEHIKQWATAYTVHIKSLKAEQVYNLSTHSAIAEVLGKPLQAIMLVTEKDMLIEMVAAVIGRHMWRYALDEHCLYASLHPQAVQCEELAWKWTTVPFDDHEAKHYLLLAQQQIYTAIKNAPDHKVWRTSCAERLTSKLLTDLDGLLATNLSATALTERNHILSELYVKGYRIGFRMRMSATKWQFHWPLSSTEFNPGTMVNESRLLYGDVLRTMGEVMKDPRAHEVQFAVSPTVTKSDYSVGGEQRVVVHNALVHITRKGYL